MTPSSQSEITIGDLVHLLWRRKWLLGVIVGSFAAVGVIYALTATPEFQAEVVAMPVGKSQLSGSLSQLGGLASLAGINIDSGDGTQAPLAVLRSKSFARDFIERHQLVDVLAKQSGSHFWSFWDGSAKPSDIRDALMGFNDKVRRVSEDKKSGLVMLDITWTDGQVAADWANEMIASLNGKLRAQAEADAEKNIAYLQKEIAGTSVAALQQSMSKILEGEMQKLLLAKGNDQFAFKVIDSATPPKLASFPKKTLIVLGAMLLGLILAVILIVVGESVFSKAATRS